MLRHIRTLAVAAGVAAAAAASLFGAAPARAAFPEQPITLIVPWAAGGGTDAIARMIAAQMEKEWKQPVNVVNRTGGSGVVGHQAIATARPDGYTIGLITLEINMMHWVGLTDLTYEGYTPFALINTDAAAIHVKTDSPYKTRQGAVRPHQGQPEQGGRVGIGAGRQLAPRARRPDAGRRHSAELDPLGAGNRCGDRAHRPRGRRGRVRVMLDAGGRGADQGRPHPQPDLHVGDARGEFPRRPDGRGSDRSQVAQGRVARHGRARRACRRRSPRSTRR